MEKDICPNCGEKALEKVPSIPGMEWLERPDLREWWGCLNCGQTFFKKVLDKPPKVCYNKTIKRKD